MVGRGGTVIENVSCSRFCRRESALHGKTFSSLPCRPRAQARHGKSAAAQLFACGHSSRSTHRHWRAESLLGAARQLVRRHAPFERPQLNSLGWASKAERNRAEPTALATIVQLLRSPNSPGPAPALSRSLGLQSSRRLQRCFAQQQQQQDVDDPASQHASSTASMLLSIAERRAAEPRCMGAVIQPTVLLWLYGCRPAHSVSWLVPIFQVSRPSGVMGHALCVMNDQWGVKTAPLRCVAASPTCL